MSDVRQVAIDAIAKVSEHPPDSIELGQDLVADLGIDSPKALQLLIEIEERLHIEISDEDAESLVTVADVVRYVEAV